MLSGTAAVLTSVGTLIHNGQDFKVGTGEAGPAAKKLRQELNDIQWGKAPDTHNWLTKIA
jgi:branched-chain amino acid aminotransferase